MNSERPGNLPSLLGLGKPCLEDILLEWREPRYRGSQILDWLFKKKVRSFEEMSNLGKELRTNLEKNFSVRSLQLARIQGSEDQTQKLLFKLADGRFIESVLIPASQGTQGDRAPRLTLCVSSQVGCALACQFCASGLAGFTRNLTAAEIVEQVLLSEEHAAKRINNLVFMGMGEPFANFKNLNQAIEILNASWGMEIGARHITVSTSGLVPQIRQFADIPLQTRLAISLHGATDDVRSRIMPINERFPLAALFDALTYYQERKKQKITFEYILIEGLNDTPEQARLLAERIRPFRAKINLIPYNTVSGFPWKRPSQEQQLQFQATLKSEGMPATLRTEKGHDIEAACGQLRLQHESELELSKPAST